MGLPDWADYIQDGVNTNRIHQLSPILVYHWQPALFRHGVNLFHFRDIFVSDIDDVLRDICYVFLRTNMLCRKFSKCSINIKIHLFKSDSDCLPRHSRIVRMHLLHILVLKLTQQKGYVISGICLAFCFWLHLHENVDQTFVKILSEMCLWKRKNWVILEVIHIWIRI